MEPPRVCSRPEFANFNFKKTFLASNYKFLDPRLKKIRFLISHRVIFTQNFLFRRKIIQDDECILCQGADRIKRSETIEHLFVNCMRVGKLWKWIEEIVWGMCNHRLKRESEYILYAQSVSVPGILGDIIWIMSSLALESIWVGKQRIRIEKKKIVGKDILNIFKAKLKMRIAVDYERMDCLTFGISWARHGILCSVDASEHRVIMNFYLNSAS